MHKLQFDEVTTRCFFTLIFDRLKYELPNTSNDLKAMRTRLKTEQYNIRNLNDEPRSQLLYVEKSVKNTMSYIGNRCLAHVPFKHEYLLKYI